MAGESSSNWETPLTSEQYPHIKRGQYSRLTQADKDVLSKIVDGRACTSGNELDNSNIDWLRIYRGTSPLLLKPESTLEVSEILRYCHGRNLAVVPQGGNTSLAGGSVPIFDEVIISLKLMDTVISFNKLSGALVCEAGCTLQFLMDYLDEKGYIMPYMIGPKATCQIGGNMSTNCGGMHVLRYGSRHSSILGVEVVLADGSVLDLLTTMKKDNTGYHLKHLFLGAEGTLGIITKVSMECPVKSPSQHMLFIGVPSFPDVLKIFKRAKYELGEILSALEVFDATVMKLINKHLKLPNPLSGESSYYMIVATAGADTRHDSEKVDNFLSQLKKEGAIQHGLKESRKDEMKHLWSYREKIAFALKHEGVCYKYDITIPHEYFYDVITELKPVLYPHTPCMACCGHLAEGDTHLNVITPILNKTIQHKIETFLYSWVKNLGGSISSEHGLGIQRRDQILYSKSYMAVEVMERVKMTFDPKCILNPYKVLPFTANNGLDKKTQSNL